MRERTYSQDETIEIPGRSKGDVRGIPGLDEEIPDEPGAIDPGPVEIPPPSEHEPDADVRYD